ncbi:MAG: hypothetical protein ACTH2Q_16115 [Propionibacteriaceae bacterium]
MGNPTEERRAGRRVARGMAAAITGLGLAASLMAVSAPAEAEQADPIEMANLPWNADLDWTEPGAFVANGQWTGPGPMEATLCLRGDPEVELGAERLYQREYDHNAEDLTSASALVMEFESNQKADEAYGTLATWATECEETLAEKDYIQTEPAVGHRVSIPGTEARFTDHALLLMDGDTEEIVSESIGAVRDGNKVALVVLDAQYVELPDWSDHNGNGKLLHPMYSSLPKVADRLIG